MYGRPIRDSEVRKCDKCGGDVYEHLRYYKYAHNGECHHCGKFFVMNEFWKLVVKNAGMRKMS